MKGFRYSIELFQEEKYRELDYGIILYVPGKNTPELNAYVKMHARSITRMINQNEDFWVQCRVKYLEPDNNFFEQRENAAFYSGMLPILDESSIGYGFLVANLDDLKPEVMDLAFEKFFRTLLKMFDEILDTGKYKKYHLQFPEAVQFDEEELQSECIALEDGAVPISGLPPRKRLQPSRRVGLSRLEIAPSNYTFNLVDFNTEIRLSRQGKALYVLFLNHPEGICMKDIRKFMNEYKELYFQVANRSDIDKLRDSVERLFDCWNSKALSVKKTECHDALCEAIPDEDIRCYYEIESKPRSPHRILLNRDLVSLPESLRSKKTNWVTKI